MDLGIRISPYRGLAMARTRLYREGKVVSEDFPVEDISAYLGEPGVCVWLEYCSPTSEDLASITEEFELHPLAVEDAVTEHERPKLDRYDSHLFLSAYTVELDTAVEVRSLGHGLHRVVARYGFMQPPDVPVALTTAGLRGLLVDSDSTYYLAHLTLFANDRIGMAAWRDKLFIVLARNARRATNFFRIPADCVIEIGIQLEL